MPLATPTPEGSPVVCLNCGSPIYWSYGAKPRNRKATWHHLYPGQFYGQMTCDPQLARAALKERHSHA